MKTFQRVAYEDQALPYFEVIAHKLIADTAWAMANVVYDELCSKHNDFYAKYRSAGAKRMWLMHCAPTLREEARQVLAQQLRDPNTSQEAKDIILDALTKDATLPRGDKHSAAIT